MKIIAYAVLVIVAISSCTKEECVRYTEEHKEIVDTVHCNIIKNKGSLVTSICNGDTLTIIQE